MRQIFDETIKETLNLRLSDLEKYFEADVILTGIGLLSF